jgi:hypothetical protein
MKPFYKDDFITLYNNDCLEHRFWVDMGEVLITDPPYGTGQIGYGRQGRQIINDLDTNTRDKAMSMWGDTKPYAVFASAKMPSPTFNWDHQLIWDKVNAGMGGKVRYQHELLFVRNFNQIGNGFSILRVSKEMNLLKKHPHAKPPSLMLKIVAGAPEGIIIDPFAGIGGTLLAAKQLGRPCIGFELDVSYCKVIAARAAQDVLM